MLPASLQLPAFRRLVAATSLSVLGSMMTFIVLPIVAWHETGSATTFSLVMAGGAIGMLVALPFGGVIADRLDRRRVILVGDVVSIAVMVTMFVAVEHDAWWALPFVELAHTFFGSLFSSAGPALRRDALPDEHREQGTAIMSAAMSAANLLGPVLGGAVYAFAGFGVVIAIDIATYAISFVLVLRVRGIRTKARRIDVDPGQGMASALRDDLREGLDVARRDAFLRRMLVGNLCGGLANGLLLVAVVPWFDDVLGHAPTLWGTMIAVMGGSALAGSIVLARIGPRIASETVMTIGAACFVAGALLLAGSPSLPRLVVSFALIGCVNAAFSVGSQTVIQRRFSSALQGRVGSLFTISFQSTQLASVLVAGVVVEAWGPAAAIDLAIVAFCTGSLWYWRSAVASRTTVSAFADEVELTVSA